MMDVKSLQREMLRLLEDYTGCKVVPANTTKQMPNYPYISYSLLNVDTRKGTYSAHTGTKIVEGIETPVNMLSMPARLKYSFTVQSDDDVEALIHSISIKDFFEESKRQELADIGLIVSDVGGITQRDNMLTIEYEYRKGLDVTLSLNNVMESADVGVISDATINDVNL